MDWSWNYTALPSLSDITWSSSRELVEVPGGADWRIRQLEHESPEYCWKYCGSSLIAQYQMEMAHKQGSHTHPDCSQLPVFYAVIPHFVSPFELSIQPKFLEKARQKLLSKMAEEYNGDAEFNFASHQISAPMACACFIEGEWRRARISKICGNSSVLVELIDYGTEVFTTPANLRPLLKKFGRFPPMALKCRVKDVCINDLNTEKIEAFRKIVVDFRGVVRVELLTSCEPFLVNLYHPTIEGENIGKLFYQPKEDINHAWRKKRRWLDHVRRERCEDDETFETKGESEMEEDENVKLYIRRFDHSPKSTHITFDEQLYVSYLENSRLIYLQSEWMSQRRIEMEQSIAEQWCCLPKLPHEWIHSGAACATKITGCFHRASITKVLEASLELLLVDHGRHVVMDKSSSSLRALPHNELFSESPLVLVVSLNGASESFPHPTFAMLLKKALPPGTRVHFQADKKHKRLPTQGRVIVAETSQDVESQLRKETYFKMLKSGDLSVLHMMGCIHSECKAQSHHTIQLARSGAKLECREVVLYRQQAISNLLHLHPNTDYVHRPHCPPQLIRGRVELAPLPSPAD